MIGSPGDIFFVMHHDNPMSHGFAYVMGSQWSHSGIIIDECQGETLVVETSDFDVVMNSFDRYVNDVNCSLEVWSPNLPSDAPQRLQACKAAKELRGLLYGYLQLLSLGLRRLFLRIGIRIPNFIHQGVVCCAIPGYAYANTNVAPLTGIDPKSYDTEELYQMIKKHFTLVLKVR